MKKRQGFTLVELIMAVLIFGFMMTSLATIYSTANRNMFYNYRTNIIKTSAGLAMRAIQNNLMTATRIDQPAFAGAGNTLAFATNVDQRSGCYPVNTSAPAGSTAWYYFCVAPDPVYPTMNDLYMHTGTINGGPGCPQANGFSYTPPYPTFCGFGGGGTVTLLVQSVVPNPVLFSRRPTELVLVNGVPTLTSSVTERDLVRVLLHAYWQAAARGFGQKGAQRDVDFTMDTVVKAQVPAQ